MNVTGCLTAETGSFGDKPDEILVPFNNLDFSTVVTEKKCTRAGSSEFDISLTVTSTSSLGK